MARMMVLICPACNQELNGCEFYLGESIICLDGRHYHKGEAKEVEVMEEGDLK